MAEEIPLDQELVNANKTNEVYGQIDDRELIRFFGRSLGLEVEEDGYLTRVGAAIKYAVERMPKEYKWGRVVNGVIENNVLDRVDITPYLQQAMSDGDGNDLDDEYSEAIKYSEKYATDIIPNLDQEAQIEAATQQGIPLSPGMDANQYTQYGDFLGLLTPQQFAQRFKDTTLEDLNQRFGESLTFSFSGTMAGAPLTASQGMTAGEAASYLYSLPPASIAKIQDALGNAGYFDRLGVNRGIRGDKDDDATRMAWEALLFDSVQMGLSPQQTLTQKIASFQSNRVPTEPVILADPASLEQDATQFGAALLGRNLSQNELRSFVTTIHDWQRKAAQGAVMTGDNIAINLEAKAQQFFEENFLQEQLGNMSAQFSARYLE